MSGLEVRAVGHTRCRKGSWAVFECDKRVSGVFNERWEAECRRDAMIRRAERRRRACLRCGGAFESDGPHHRMCVECRRDPGDGADDVYALAVST